MDDSEVPNCYVSAIATTDEPTTSAALASYAIPNVPPLEIHLTSDKKQAFILPNEKPGEYNHLDLAGAKTFEELAEKLKSAKLEPESAEKTDVCFGISPYEGFIYTMARRGGKFETRLIEIDRFPIISFNGSYDESKFVEGLARSALSYKSSDLARKVDAVYKGFNPEICGQQAIYVNEKFTLVSVQENGELIVSGGSL
ncbi:MAG: hypothetical protein V1820_02825 [archaeon]